MKTILIELDEIFLSFFHSYLDESVWQTFKKCLCISLQPFVFGVSTNRECNANILENTLHTYTVHTLSLLLLLFYPGGHRSTCCWLSIFKHKIHYILCLRLMSVRIVDGKLDQE